MPDRRPVEERFYTGAFEIDPGPGYRIERFAPSAPGGSVAREDVLAFWEREEAVGAVIAQERIDEVRVVTLHEDDGLVGVTSTFLCPVPHLRLELWQPRIFVASGHRRGNLGVAMCVELVDLLRERFVSGADTRGPGIIHLVENEGLRKRFNQAVWPVPVAIYIGEADDGVPMRVEYFPGAIVPTSP